MNQETIANELDEKQKQAAGLLSRGYSRTTAAHVLGIRKVLIDEWYDLEAFRREVEALRAQPGTTRRF